MHDDLRLVAGECTTTFDGQRDREHRGEVLALVKPDCWPQSGGLP